LVSLGFPWQEGAVRFDTSARKPLKKAEARSGSHCYFPPKKQAMKSRRALPTNGPVLVIETLDGAGE
jgi:hypothetical protein